MSFELEGLALGQAKSPHTGALSHKAVQKRVGPRPRLLRMRDTAFIQGYPEVWRERFPYHPRPPRAPRHGASSTPERGDSAATRTPRAPASGRFPRRIARAHDGVGAATPCKLGVNVFNKGRRWRGKKRTGGNDRVRQDDVQPDGYAFRGRKVFTEAG